MLACGAKWGKMGKKGKPAVLLGEYEHSIDDRGRLAVPARFRDEFKAGVILARGFDRCLLVYSIEEWRKVADRLADLPVTQSTVRRVNRTTFSSAFKLDLDRQGRILLPGRLREYAQLNDDVVIVGMYRYLEIWSKTLWDGERSVMEDQAWQIAEAVEVQP